MSARKLEKFVVSGKADLRGKSERDYSKEISNHMNQIVQNGKIVFERGKQIIKKGEMEIKK